MAFKKDFKSMFNNWHLQDCFEIFNEAVNMHSEKNSFVNITIWLSEKSLQLS